MLTIRGETPRDFLAVHSVNQAAFDTPTEANLVDALRRSAQPYISLVAELEGQVVGHIFFSPVTIEADGSTYTALGLPWRCCRDTRTEGSALLWSGRG